ncbi:WD40-repeat-containing domain protein [Pyronema omphalodes]|nr:WD40-repeat-containing domain protein [Pyronema omphalodes]
MVFSTRRQTGILSAHTGAVHALTYSSGAATYCLSGGADRKIHLYNPSTSTLIQTYTAHGHEVLDISCSPDNALFASCGGDKLVFLWDVSTATTLRRFEGHWGRINAVDFNFDGSVLVSGSYDASIKCWDIKSNSRKPIQSLEDAKDAISDVKCYGHEIISASVDGRVRSYDVRMGRCTVDVVSPSPVTSVAVSRDGAAMVTAALDGVVRLIDRANGGLLMAYKGHKNTELRVRAGFAEQEQYVVCGSENGEIWVWDLMDGKSSERLRCHGGKVVSSVAYCPAQGRKQMVTGGADGTVVVWGE